MGTWARICLQIVVCDVTATDTPSGYPPRGVPEGVSVAVTAQIISLVRCCSSHRHDRQTIILSPSIESCSTLFIPTRARATGLVPRGSNHDSVTRLSDVAFVHASLSVLLSRSLFPDLDFLFNFKHEM